jgi:ribose-phosphate pyrophosphokinase
VIYDDMIRTGSSLIQAAKAYTDAGAKKCHAISSHLILPPGALDKLRSSGLFEHILGTDSHPGSLQLAGVPGAITSVASVFVKAMDRTHRV